jgi:hypothetical protein
MLLFKTNINAGLLLDNHRTWPKHIKSKKLQLNIRLLMLLFRNTHMNLKLNC